MVFSGMCLNPRRFIGYLCSNTKHVYTFQSYIGIRPDIITLCGSRALQHNMDLDKNCRNLSGGSFDTPNYEDLIEFDF